MIGLSGAGKAQYSKPLPCLVRPRIMTSTRSRHHGTRPLQYRPQSGLNLQDLADYFDQSLSQYLESSTSKDATVAATLITPTTRALHCGLLTVWIHITKAPRLLRLPTNCIVGPFRRDASLDRPWRRA
jgi:hypothetical protein